MENTNIDNNDFIDLGSDPIGEDFDPFSEDSNDVVTDTDTTTDTEADTADDTDEPTDTDTSQKSESAKATPAENFAKKTDVKEADAVGCADKPPVFEYAGATENIDDGSKTFDELRIEKSADFPESEDGKRVSWTVEYGKVTKSVADPKGTSISKMKSDIETSKEFEDSLKKRGADKNPTCKIKPRVTAQSKGEGTSAYKGIFANVEEAAAAGKVISIVPGKDGRVYEIRNTEMGKFTTPVTDCDILSEVRAGFVPALPRIPAELMMKVISFFRHFINDKRPEDTGARNASSARFREAKIMSGDKEALINIYWDKENAEYIVDAPEQVVTKVSVHSQISEKYDNDRYIHYMDIHSHNTMGAFFSAVDNADEKATRLYTVIGKLNECVPEVKTRISNGGKFLDIDPAEVFECVGTSFPEEWKDKVRFRVTHNKSNPNAFACLLMARDKLMDGVDDYALCA